MGRLFKAIIGFGIAFYVWSPASFAAHFDTPAVTGLRAQIEAQKPREQLMMQFAAMRHDLNLDAASPSKAGG